MSKSRIPIGVCSCGTVFYSSGHRKYHTCPKAAKPQPTDADQPRQKS